MNSRQNKGVTTNRTSSLRGNLSVNHNTELNTWKHVIDNMSPTDVSKKMGVKSGAPEGYVAPATLVTPVMSLQLQSL